MNAGQTRDRLLLAAAELMHESGEPTVSTRAVCERAGVEAPTLYHHFGSKQGLIDAVIQHGFNQYVDPESAHDRALDPIDAIRHGWDRHVRFGLENPRFYALLYGNVERGRPCAITSPALARLTDLVTKALARPLREALQRVARRRWPPLAPSRTASIPSCFIAADLSIPDRAATVIAET